MRYHTTKVKQTLLAMLLLTPLTAGATLFSFNYTFDNNSVLEGTLDGTLQSDSDTVFINSFDSVYYSGTALASIEENDIRSDSDYPAGALQPLVSLSGDTMDVFVCALGFSSAGNCTFSIQGGFYLGTASNNSAAGNPGVVSTFEGYDAGQWNMSPVPVPAAIWMLGPGLIGLSAIRKVKS